MNKREDIQGIYIILNKTKSTDYKLFVKIGSSKHCNKRYNEICSSYRFNGMDDELELMRIIPCVQNRKMERHAHLSLKAYRKTGEYFLVDKSKLEERINMILNNIADYN